MVPEILLLDITSFGLTIASFITTPIPHQQRAPEGVVQVAYPLSEMRGARNVSDCGVFQILEYLH